MIKLDVSEFLTEFVVGTSFLTSFFTYTLFTFSFLEVVTFSVESGCFDATKNDVFPESTCSETFTSFYTLDFACIIVVDEFERLLVGSFPFSIDRNSNFDLKLLKISLISSLASCPFSVFLMMQDLPTTFYIYKLLVYLRST